MLKGVLGVLGVGADDNSLKITRNTQATEAYNSNFTFITVEDPKKSSKCKYFKDKITLE